MSAPFQGPEQQREPFANTPVLAVPPPPPSQGWGLIFPVCVFFFHRQDKFAVKEIVRAWQASSDDELAISETYHVIRDAAEITLGMVEQLPDNFVFKGTHGSGMVMLVKGVRQLRHHTNLLCAVDVAVAVL